MNDAAAVALILALIGVLAMMVSRRRRREAQEARDAAAVREMTGVDLTRPRENPFAGLFGLVALLIVVGYGLTNPLGFVGLALGAVTAAVAASRGSPNFLGWWGLGALLPVVSIPFAFLARDRRQDALIAVARVAASRRAHDDDDGTDDDDEVGDPAIDGYPSWVAGLSHHSQEVRRRAARAGPGAALAMVRDPFNAADPRAVELHLGGERLGFVPARHAAWVSERLDAGRPMTAEIAGCDVVDGLAVRVWTRLFRS